jgi:hypothetical protein
VRKFDLVPGGVPLTLGGECEVAFADEYGEQRLPLTEVWSVPFESCLPVRRFPSYKGQRNHVGRWSPLLKLCWPHSSMPSMGWWHGSHSTRYKGCMDDSTSGWTYRYTDKGTTRGGGDLHNEPVTRHMNTMAAEGWELVSANATDDGTFVSHNFYWKKRSLRTGR